MKKRDDDCFKTPEEDNKDIFSNLKKNLDYSLVKLCENLPLNLTLFESEGRCLRPNDICEYCRPIKRYYQHSYAGWLCIKKTYTVDVSRFKPA